MGILLWVAEDNPEEYARKFSKNTEPDSYAVCKICGETLGEHSGVKCPTDKEIQAEEKEQVC